MMSFITSNSLLVKLLIRKGYKIMMIR